MNMTTNFDELEEERIGEENEDDLTNVDKDNFSDAVLWSTDWTTETIISQLKKGNIELNPEFQRRDAWGADRKSSFIESIILGLPIPQIILAERKDKRGSYIVIDGKQRLLSIRQFCVTDEDDVFTPLKLKGMKILKDLNGKDFNKIKGELDFSRYISAFENQSIRTVFIRNWPNQNFLYTVFLRLNAGSLPLSPQELRQALNPGLFTSFADNFSRENEQIQKALGIKKPDYRMRDVEVVVRYFAFKNFIESYTGNLKDFLDRTCELINVRWVNERDFFEHQAEELNNAIKGTFEIFSENAFCKFADGQFTRIFNRPIYDIMTYYLSIPEVRSAAIDNKHEVKQRFQNLCSTDIDFLKSLEASTKNVEPTSKRFFAWGSVLKEVLNLEMKVPQRTNDGIKLL